MTTGLAKRRARTAHGDALTAELERRFATLDRDTVLARLIDAGVSAGRIRGIDEVYDWEQDRSQWLALDVDHPTLGTITLPGMALRTLEMSPVGELRGSTRLEHDPPPLLDGDGPAIRNWPRR